MGALAWRCGAHSRDHTAEAKKSPSGVAPEGLKSF